MRKQSREPGVDRATAIPGIPPVVHAVLNRGGGQPLDTATRAFMKPRFGHDFSRVRIHADERAAESAQSINALAYTVGNDIVFGAGQYAPMTAMGQRLLAHELTHTYSTVNSWFGSSMSGCTACIHANPCSWLFSFKCEHAISPCSTSSWLWHWLAIMKAEEIQVVSLVRRN